MPAEAARFPGTIAKRINLAIILVAAVWGLTVSLAKADTENGAILSGIVINGPTSVKSNSSADYTATATYSDGTSRNITNDVTWSENSTYASINGSGHLTTTSVSSSQSLTVSASYNMKTAGLSVTIVGSRSISRRGTTSGTGTTSGSRTPSRSRTLSRTYTITASAGSNGTISPSGNVSVRQGLNQTFTITANNGYKVQNVLVDGTSAGAVTSYTFTSVTASHTISANFVANTTASYIITASAGSNGAISPSGNVSARQGSNQTFTITANNGYKVQSVLVDGSSVGAVTSYTFTNVTASHTISASFSTSSTSSLSGTYQIFAFNDLGMHCYDPDFSVFSILPLYNVVHAQVVKQGSSPQIMDSSVDVKYKSIADGSGSINTSSIGKTNFWEYVDALYGTSPALDEGLMGAKMPGASNQAQSMIWEGGSTNWFGAAGIPITSYDDKLNLNNYPLMNVHAVDPSNSKVLSSLPTVIPVSDEMSCGVCHLTGDVATKQTGISWSQNTNPDIQFRENILLLHDYRNSTNLSSSQPVLCASCHYSAALDLNKTGPTGSQVGNKTMSAATHGYHATRITTLPPSGNVCYYCHPGEKTDCNRGAMATAGLVCIDCHGNMTAVAQPTRHPWVDLPKCQSCHTGDAVNHSGSQIIGRVAYTGSASSPTPIIATNKMFAEQDNTLYRNSVGHNGIACESCHGSTHAEWPTQEPNDNLTATTIQGHDGKITECAVCHGTGLSLTTNGGPHGLHNVNSSAWVSGHENRASSQACGTCHGTTGAGTVLSKAAANRTFSVEGRTVSIAKGTQIGCNTCHSNPL